MIVFFPIVLFLLYCRLHYDVIERKRMRMITDMIRSTSHFRVN